MNRRAFIRTSLAGATAFAAAPAPAQAAHPALRTIAYNVFGCQGWPKTRRNQSRRQAAAAQMPERLALELALYRPHIINLSEAPPEEDVARIAGRLDMNYAFFPSPEGFPGAVLSTFAILESANCPLQPGRERPSELHTRHFGRALLESPLGPLAFYSVHLNPHREEVRLREIQGILHAVGQHGDEERPLLIQGDLNHKPDTSEYRAWTTAGLIDTFKQKGTGQAFTVSAMKPGLRIDYIWANAQLASHLTGARVLFEGAFRAHKEDPTAFALSDHLPLYASFEV